MSKERIFFKGLNELRAFAALAVVFHHIELYKHRDHIASLHDTPLAYFIKNLGKNGVYLFYTLSGFLITYLLLEEIRFNGSISFRNFYIRRILRIWPLYYFIVLISFIAVPLLAYLPLFSQEYYYMKLINQLHYGFNFVLFLLFLSNLAFIIYKPVVGASQSWSVSVEEQFYIIWPMLLNRFKKRPWIILLGVIFLKLFLLFACIKANEIFFYGHNIYLNVLKKFLQTLSFELMSIGGLGAWFFI